LHALPFCSDLNYGTQLQHIAKKNKKHKYLKIYFKETHFSVRVDDDLFFFNEQVTKFEETSLEALQMGYTVELGYSNIGFCDTFPIASNTQWYKLIPHKATVFIPCLVRHSQMHQPHTSRHFHS
jgi:hypothetical protein